MTFDSFANLHIIKNKNIKQIKDSILDVQTNFREYQRQNKFKGKLSEDTINRIRVIEDSELKQLKSVCESIEYHLDQILLAEMKAKKIQQQQQSPQQQPERTTTQVIK